MPEGGETPQPEKLPDTWRPSGLNPDKELWTYYGHVLDEQHRHEDRYVRTITIFTGLISATVGAALIVAGLFREQPVLQFAAVVAAGILVWIVARAALGAEDEVHGRCIKDISTRAKVESDLGLDRRRQQPAPGFLQNESFIFPGDFASRYGTKITTSGEFVEHSKRPKCSKRPRPVWAVALFRLLRLLGALAAMIAGLAGGAWALLRG